MLWTPQSCAHCLRNAVWTRAAILWFFKACPHSSVRGILVAKCARAAGDGLYEVTVHDERRDMWQIYLEQQDYDNAIRHCRKQVTMLLHP